MSTREKIIDYPKHISWIQMKENCNFECPHDRWEWIDDENSAQANAEGKVLEYQGGCFDLMNRYDCLVSSYITFLNGVSYSPSLVEDIEKEMLEIAEKMKRRRSTCAFVEWFFEMMEANPENVWEKNREKILKRKQENL